MKTTRKSWSCGVKAVDPYHNHLGVGWCYCGMSRTKRDAVDAMRSHAAALNKRAIVPLYRWADFGNEDVLKDVLKS